MEFSCLVFFLNITGGVIFMPFLHLWDGRAWIIHHDVCIIYSFDKVTHTVVEEISLGHIKCWSLWGMNVKFIPILIVIIQYTGCTKIVCKAKISKSFYEKLLQPNTLYRWYKREIKKNGETINLSHFNPHFRIDWCRESNLKREASKWNDTTLVQGQISDRKINL